MPVNTAYLNVGPAPVGATSQFTVALNATTVIGGNQAESSFSIPARLIPLNKTTFVNTGAPLMVAPDSAISAGLVYCAYLVPTTNTVTLRFSNGSSTVTSVQRAGTWGFAFYQGLP